MVTVSAVLVVPLPNRQSGPVGDLFDRPNRLGQRGVFLRQLPVDARRRPSGLVGLLNADDQLRVVVWRFNREQQQPRCLPKDRGESDPGAQVTFATVRVESLDTEPP